MELEELAAEVWGELAGAPAAVLEASLKIFQNYGTGVPPISAIHDAVHGSRSPVSINGHPPSRYKVRTIKATPEPPPKPRVPEKRAPPAPTRPAKKRRLLPVTTSDSPLPVAAAPRVPDFELSLDDLVEPEEASTCGGGGTAGGCFPSARPSLEAVKFVVVPTPPPGAAVPPLQLPSLDDLVEGTWRTPQVELFSEPRWNDDFDKPLPLDTSVKGRRYVPYYERQRLHEQREKFRTAVAQTLAGEDALPPSALMGPVLLGGCAPDASTPASVR